MKLCNDPGHTLPGTLVERLQALRAKIYGPENIAVLNDAVDALKPADPDKLVDGPVFRQVVDTAVKHVMDKLAATTFVRVNDDEVKIEAEDYRRQRDEARAEARSLAESRDAFKAQAHLDRDTHSRASRACAELQDERDEARKECDALQLKLNGANAACNRVVASRDAIQRARDFVRDQLHKAEHTIRALQADVDQLRNAGTYPPGRSYEVTVSMAHYDARTAPANMDAYVAEVRQAFGLGQLAMLETVSHLSGTHAWGRDGEWVAKFRTLCET